MPQAPLWPVGHVPSLCVWLTMAVQEPNWPAGMSLPLLENLIKTSAWATLLHVTSPRQKGWRKKYIEQQRGQDRGGVGPRRPLNPVPTAAPNLAKTCFHKMLGHPRLTALCYFIQNYPSSVSLADTEAFMGKKKNNNHFYKINKEPQATSQGRAPRDSSSHFCRQLS